MMKFFHLLSNELVTLVVSSESGNVSVLLCCWLAGRGYCSGSFWNSSLKLCCVSVGRRFDVCIIDEASQITLPICLGPLQHAGIFVLVGDHYQLPPLVLSHKAREGGLDVSLFRYLSERHPAALVSLKKQYRMNREIMDVANHLIYNERLKCGSKEVAMRRLRLPLLQSRPSISKERDGWIGKTLETLENHEIRWVEKVLDPQHPVLFLDTDNCTDAEEVTRGGQIHNVLEATLVAKLVTNLIKYGLTGDEIGVITPLRHQQILIQERLATPSCQSPSIDVKDMSPAQLSLSLVEVNTVDKYQGRDKECIIVSFVRSNSRGNTGMLLQDWRRINVAITRAKYKLFLVGSSSTLSHAPFLQCMLNLLAQQNQIMSVPVGVMK